MTNQISINRSIRIQVGYRKPLVWVHTDRSSFSRHMRREAAAAVKQAQKQLGNSGEIFLRHQRGRAEYSTNKKNWHKVKIREAKGVNARIIRTSAALSSVEKTGIQRVKHRLLKGAKGDRVLLKLLCTLLLKPIMILDRLLAPEWMNELTMLSEKQPPHSAQALEEALGEAALILDPDENSMKQRIDEGLDVVARLKDGEPLEEITSDLAKLIVTRHKDAKEGEVLSLFPTGFWREGETYEPVLIALTRGPGGSLSLTELGYGEDDGKRVQDFSMKDLSAKQLNLALTGLFLAGMPPGKMEGMLEQHAPGLIHLGISPETLVQGSATEAVNQLTADPNIAWRERVLFSTGFEKGDPVMESRMNMRADPMKLVQETLRRNLPEANIADKCEFTARILQRRMRRFFEHTNELNPKQREEFISNLDHLVEGINRGNIKVDNPIDKIGELAGKIKSALDKTRALSLDIQTRRMKRLDHPKANKFSLRVLDRIARKGSNKSSIKAACKLTAADRVLIQSIQDGFTSKEPQQIKGAVEALFQLQLRCDALVNTKGYDAVIQAFESIMPHIPIPGLNDDVFEKMMEAAEDSTLFTKLTSGIGRMNHFFWESILHTSPLKVTGEQWIHMMTAQASTRKIIQTRKEYLLKLPENDRGVEEKQFLKIADDLVEIDNYDKQLFNQIYHESCLGPCADPKLEMRLRAAIEFFTGLPECSFYHSSGNSQKRIRHENMIKKVTEQDTKEVWHKILILDPKADFPIPGELADLERLNLIMTSTLFANTAVGQYGVTLAGMGQFAGAFLGKKTNEGSVARAQRNFKQSLRDIRKMKRIDFGGFIDIAGITSYGVRTRGSNPRKRIRQVISPGGITYVQAITLQQIEIDSFNDAPIEISQPHQDALGYPDSMIADYNAKVWRKEIKKKEAEANRFAEANCVNDDKYTLGALQSIQLMDNDQFMGIDQSLSSNIENVVDLCIQSPHLLDRDGVKRRLFEVLTRPHVISKSIEINPTFFIEHKEALTRVIETALKNGKLERAHHLLGICTVLYHHFNSKELKEGWPHFDEARIDESISQFAELGAHGQNELFCSILEAYALHPDAYFPEQLELSPTRLGQLLNMAGRLDLVKNDLSIPARGQTGVSWAKANLVRWIASFPPEKRDEILNEWVKALQENVPKGPWQAAEGEELVFHSGDDTIVDLNNLMILKFKGSEVKGVHTNLPEAIRESSLYQGAFGDVNYACIMQPGSNPGEYVYSFKDHKDQKFRIYYSKNENDIQTHRMAEIRKGKERWEILHQPTALRKKVEKKKRPWALNKLKGMIEAKSSEKPLPKGTEKFEGNGIEKRLLKHGIWIQAGQNKAHAFLGDTITDSNKDHQVTINLTSSGSIRNIRTKDGLEITHDADDSLHKLIGPLPSDQVLFLRKPGHRAITEIRLLNQGIKLRRASAKKTWVLSGVAGLEGAKLVVGKDRGEEVNSLLQQIGSSLEQTGLAVKQNGSTHLLLWPHPVKDAGDILHLKKIKHYNAPLRLTFSEGVEPTGSAGSFAHLAYLCAAKHDYSRAAYFLNKARNTRIRSENDLSQLIALETFSQELPVTSVRSAAIKLKLQLTIRHIFREQTNKRDFTQGKWSEYLSNVQQIAETFSNYQERLERSIYGKGARGNVEQSLTELTLDAIEIDELKHVTTESLEWALSQPFRRENELQTSDKTLSISQCSKEEMTSAIQLGMLSVSKNQIPPNEIIKRLPKQPELLLEHFLDLFAYVADKGLNEKEKLILLRTIDLKIQDKVGIEETIDFTDKSLFDLLRRALISMNASEKKVKLDRDILRAASEALPQSLKAAAFRRLVKGRSIGKLFKEKDARIQKGIQHIEELLIEWNPLEKAVVWGQSPIDDKNQKNLVDPAVLKKPVGNKRGVDIARLKQQLQTEQYQGAFGPDLPSLIIASLDDPKLLDGQLPADKLVQEVERAIGINLVTVLHEEQMRVRIADLEMTPPQKNVLEECNPVIPLKNVESKSEQFIKADSGDLQQNVNATVEAFKQLLEGKESEGDLAKFRTTDRKDLLDGLNTAKLSLLEELKGRVSVEIHAVDKIKEEAKDLARNYEQKAKNERVRLLNCLINLKTSVKIPVTLRKLIATHEEVGVSPLISEAIMAYQMGEIKDDIAVQSITNYLLYTSGMHVLNGRVANRINALKNLVEQGDSGDSNSWISLSTELLSDLKNACDLHRYCTDGKLKEPSLYRKVLVLESQKGYFVSPNQIDLIKNMVERPNDWYELKVGAGKTSTVLPIVLMMLLEKGEFPTAVVKDALLQQNLADLDEATRELLGRAAVAFEFNINSNSSVTALQEQYARLLQAKRDKNYPITTVSSLISLDQRIDLLRTDEAELLKQLMEKVGSADKIMEIAEQGIHIQGEDKETLDLTMKLDGIQKQIFYISKISKLFDLLIMDEVDDLQDVVCENNVGIDEPIPFETEICDVVKQILRVGHTSDDPNVKKLFKALRNNSQVSIDEKELKQQLLPSLAKAIISDKDNLLSLKLPGEAITRLEAVDAQERFVEYLCQTSGTEPFAPGIELNELAMRRVASLKKQLQQALPIALRQNPGIDIGFKKDGYQLGPRVAGAERDTLFGESHDILVNHYLTYSVRIPDNDFFREQLEIMSEENPDRFKGWANKAKSADLKDIIAYLNRAENYDERFHLLDARILNLGRIKRYKKQIVYNVQDVSRGRRVGGMTGTLNRDALFRQKEDADYNISYAKQATARVLLDAAVLHGMPKVHTAKTSMNLDKNKVFDRLLHHVKDKECKAAMNQGFDFSGLKTEEIIAKLKEEAPERIFVYIDSKEGKYNIWEPEKEPRTIDKQDLNKMLEKTTFRENVFAFFSPKDTRGTDFRLPPGYSIALISDKCSVQDLVQTWGRMRQAGVTQSINEVIISNATGDKMVANYDLKGKNNISYAHLVDDVSGQTVPEQASKNLKSASEEFRRIVKMGTRRLITLPHEHMDDPEYWSLQNPMKRLIDTTIRQMFAKVAEDDETGWLYDSKEVDFKGDFQPTSMENTKENFQKVYEGALEQVNSIKQVSNEISPIPLLVQALKIAGLTPLNEEERKWAISQVKSMNAHIENMLEDLEKAKNSFDLRADNKDRTVFPENVPSMGSGMPVTQAQVQVQQQQQQQQQVQQQQQQQTQTQQQASNVGGDARKYEDWRWLQENVLTFKKWKNSLRPPQDACDQMLIFWNEIGDDLIISQGFRNIFSELGGMHGDMKNVRLYLERSGRVTLINRQDYQKHARKRVLNGKAKAVYSIVDPRNHGGVSFLANALGKSRPDLEDKDLMLRMSLAKVFLGIAIFTEQEEHTLRDWFATLDSKCRPGLLIFASRFGSEEQVSHLEKLWPA